MKGTLYVCATPIGNLGDITLRALETLRSVDLIAAEDTRHTQKLLNHYEISVPTTSYHEHNRYDKADFIIDELVGGKNVALVSDAGTPGISDPGEVLINKAIENDIDVVPIPGASAVIAALIVSGLSTERFHFEGFIPRKKKERMAFWESRKDLDGSIVFYEAPHRLLSSLKDLLSAVGDRNLAVARELTKRYEEVYRGTISEAIEYFGQKTVKGELAIVVDGASEVTRAQNLEVPETEDEIVVEVKKSMLDGQTKKAAIKHVAQKFGLDRNLVYKAAIVIKER